jgi:hypothetical protein
MRRLIWGAAIVLAFAFGVVVGHPAWRQAFVRRLSGLAWHPESGRVARDLPTLVVDMAFADYDLLLEQRERALQSGVVRSSPQHFVSASIRVDDVAVPVVMRLLEGPAENLGADDKWAFEVRTEYDAQILGLHRFDLQDPASNNWLNQWAFVESLRREGILAPRYRFVHLVFNGSDRGIYALQESFAGGLLEAPDYPRGAVLGFDADLLWDSIASFEGDMQAVYADPVANFSAADIQYLEIDTFRETVVAGDAGLTAQQDRAIELLHALQTGQRPASSVFDVERYGRFLALVDLWGATEGMSLINLRFYYNAADDRLVPISCNSNPLGSETRLSLAATYDDPYLQVAYVQEAARVSQPEYLDRLQGELEESWRRLARVMRRESGDLSPPWGSLHRRQEQMRRSLDPVQPVFAYLATSSSMSLSTHHEVLRVGVGNVLNLPIELLGFDIGGATFLEVDPLWVQGAPIDLLMSDGKGPEEGAAAVVLRPLDRARSPVVHYVEFDIPLTVLYSVDRELDFSQEPDVYVQTRILGSPTVRMTLARHGLPTLLSVVGGE